MESWLEYIQCLLQYKEQADAKKAFERGMIAISDKEQLVLRYNQMVTSHQ